MTTTLLTYYLPTPSENYQELADLTIPQRDEYCARHGYRHLVCKGPYRDPGLYYAIQRLWFLLDDMAGPSATDLYWIFNVQGLLTNHTVPITQFVDDEHDFYVSHDVNGLNAGSFVVRNTEWGRKWIRKVAEEAPFVNHCWWEQKRMSELENDPEWKPKIKICPPSQFNSYSYALYNWPPTTPGDWRKGDLVLSLPGLNLQQRLDIARSDKWRDAVIR